MVIGFYADYTNHGCYSHSDYCWKRGEKMKTLTVKKVNSDTALTNSNKPFTPNNGQQFERALWVHFGNKLEDWRPDNGNYRTTCDIANISAKTANSTLGVITGDRSLSSFVIEFAHSNFAEVVWFGLELVDEVDSDYWAVLEVNRNQLAVFLMDVCRIGSMSPSRLASYKDKSTKMVKVDKLRSKKMQNTYWRLAQRVA